MIIIFYGIVVVKAAVSIISVVVLLLLIDNIKKIKKIRRRRKKTWSNRKGTHITHLRPHDRPDVVTHTRYTRDRDVSISFVAFFATLPSSNGRKFCPLHH